jgi:PKD repeat protein
MVNGFADNTHTTPATSAVWKQGVTIVPGHTYSFSCWVLNLCNDPHLNPEIPAVQLAISYGVGPTFETVTNPLSLPYPSTCDPNNPSMGTCCGAWQPICASWTAPDCIPANVTLNILLPGQCGTQCGSGNDIGIDDISFMEITPSTTNADFTYTRIACNRDIPFSANDQSGFHTWDFGDGATSTDINPSHKYTAPGIYAVTHTIKNGSCGNGSKAVPITVESCCTCSGSMDPSQNLVKDGDFSIPCGTWPRWYESDFAEDFPCTTLVPSGWDHFVQTRSTIGGGRPYCDLRDHSHPGNTDFLIVDAGVNLPKVRRAWYQDGPVPGVIGEGYTVSVGQTYCFKASFNNPNFQHPQKASVRLVIKGCNDSVTVATLDYLQYNDKCGWVTVCGCWTATCDHVKELAIYVYANDCDPGNDFAIDDIIFSPTNTCSQACDAETQHDQTGWQLQPVKTNDPTQEKQDDSKENLDKLNLEQNPDGASELNLNPIPVHQGVDLLLTYETKTGENLVVQIINTQGKIMSTVNKQILPGKNEMILKTDMLNPGTYIVKTVSGTTVHSKTIIVQ